LKQLKSQPVSLEAFAPDVAPETAYVINRMLEKNPDDRYAGYAELVEHLEFARAKVLERAGRPADARQREVVKVETSRTKLYVALITLCAALLLLGAGAWLFLTSERGEIKAMREGLFGAADNLPKVDPLDAGFAALSGGDWPKAREVFSSVVQTAEPRSLRAQWAKASLAAVLALDGAKDQARDQWRQIDLAGVFSDKAEDLPLANLFLDAANFGLRGSPVSVDALSKYPQQGPGALIYFFVGVDNYALGEKEAARAMLAKFLSIPPATNVPYWDAYRGAAEKLSKP